MRLLCTLWLPPLGLFILSGLLAGKGPMNALTGTLGVVRSYLVMAGPAIHVLLYPVPDILQSEERRPAIHTAAIVAGMPGDTIPFIPPRGRWKNPSPFFAFPIAMRNGSMWMLLEG